MSAETLHLSEQDRALLQTEKMTREVRVRVREALHWSGVHPVSMDFGLAHPILNALNFGHDGSYKLVLALNKWDKLSEDYLTAVDRSLLEWGEVRVQPTRTKEASWKDQVNWYIQRHWSGGNL
jgi:hypothetical protein